MDGSLLQTLIVGLIVLGALAYVGRRVWRTVAAGRAPKDDGCGGGCDCGH